MDSGNFVMRRMVLTKVVNNAQELEPSMCGLKFHISIPFHIVFAPLIRFQPE